MPRTGLLVGLAALLIVGAVGVLYATNFLKLEGADELSQTVPARHSGAPTQGSKESKWVQDMVQSVGANGYAATFSDDNVNKWVLTSGHRLERFAVDGKGTMFARLSSEHPITNQTLLDGVFAELPKDFANYSAGHRVEVGIVARMPTANPADKFSVIYLTRQAGNSGWRTFSLTTEFQLLKFEYEVPKVDGGYDANPIVSIFGDPAGGGKGVELLGMYVKAKP